MQTMREQGTRNALQRAGVTDAATQDAIVAHAAAQEKARQSLREQSRKLFDSLRDAPSTDAEIATALRTLRANVAAEKLRSTRALTDLNSKTNYTKQPRLEALLTMMGLVGDEAAYIGAMPGAMRGGAAGGQGGWGGQGGNGGWGGQGGNSGRGWGGPGDGGRGGRGGGRGGQGGNGQGGNGQGRENRSESVGGVANDEYPGSTNNVQASNQQ
jgi:hypothetical protein